jgi:hypothetical protein
MVQTIYTTTYRFRGRAVDLSNWIAVPSDLFLRLSSSPSARRIEHESKSDAQ